MPRGRTTPPARPVLFQTGVRRRRPVRKRLLAVAAALVALFVIAVVVASWFLSGLLIDPHHDLVNDNIETLAVGHGRIVLARTHDSQRNGVYGLDWRSGHAVVGKLISTTSSTVTRRLMSLAGRLAPHEKVGLDPDVWTTNPRAALGIDYRPLSFPDPLGAMPAWLVAGQGSTWVIFVHGIDGSRTGGLRPLASLHSLGFPTLLIDYRNDAGAPASPDGHVHLGMTEWQDLQAAVRWAVQQGAQRLVLYGDSMGRLDRHPVHGRVIAVEQGHRIGARRAGAELGGGYRPPGVAPVLAVYGAPGQVDGRGQDQRQLERAG